MKFSTTLAKMLPSVDHSGKSSSGEVSFSHDLKDGLIDWLIDGAIYHFRQIDPQSTIAKIPTWTADP